jgi:hypothetical protein
VEQTAGRRRRLLAMKKGYQGDELWTAVNPATGKRNIVDPEGRVHSGRDNHEAVLLQAAGGYVTIPEIRFSKSLRMGVRSNLLAKTFPNKIHHT